jgi:protocatechuate 3,4-dioxygenase, alpha subunit
MTIPATTSQTVGPYFAIGLNWLLTTDLAGPGVPGEQFRLEGRVLDANRQPIPDAVIEIWQANAAGKYAHEEDTQEKPIDGLFHGFGRVATDKDGVFRLSSVKPGATPGPHETMQAPHLEVSVFMRGLLIRLTTRVYFGDEAAANATDPILNLVPAARRETIIAKKMEDGVFHWDVLMQGDDETVFFDV